MKHIRRFNNFQPINEELGGLGVLAIAGLALAAGGIYTKAKQMWSKHITASKYQSTGNTEKVNNMETGKEEIISEYQDRDGNLYWGYDHMWNPDPQMEESPRNLDLYRAIFRVEDKARLIKFLQGIKVKTSMPEMDYLDKPKPVDMIFLKDYDKERMANSGY